MTHTVIELPAPSYRHDYEGDVVSTDWEVQPPEGFTDAVDEHECAAGAECCYASPHDTKGTGVGFTLWEDDYGLDHLRWEAWLVDARWVVCEDCANSIEEGDLSVTPDGVWTWKQEVLTFETPVSCPDEVEVEVIAFPEVDQ